MIRCLRQSFLCGLKLTGDGIGEVSLVSGCSSKSVTKQKGDRRKARAAMVALLQLLRGPYEESVLLNKIISRCLLQFQARVSQL